MIGDENAVAKELDRILAPIEASGDLGEIEDPFEVERIVDIEMDPEDRIGLERIKRMIEFEVFSIGALRGVFKPERLFFVDLRAIEVDRKRQKRTVVLQDRADARFFEEFIVFFVDEQSDFCAALCARAYI